MPLAATALLALLAPLAAAAPASHASRAAAPRTVRTAAPAPTPAATRAWRAEALTRDTLAWVGGRGITVADLVQRIEAMPWPGKRAGASMDSAKVRALQSLAAEALLAEDAERLGLGDSPAIARMRAVLRKALVRDALYHDVVAAEPAVAAADVERLTRARARTLDLAGRRALRKAVTDSLKQVGEQRRAVAFMEQTLAGQRAMVDTATFVMLADTLHALIAASAVPGRDSSVQLPATVDPLMARLAASLERPLVHLPDGSLSLGEALETFRLQPLPISMRPKRRMAVDLSIALRAVVEGELMAREGLRRHLDELPEVRHDLAMWTATWRAQVRLESLMPGPAPSEDDAFHALALYQPARARALCEVDVAEVLGDSRAEAARTRALLDAGADLDSLARASTRRVAWRARGGRSGFVPVRRYPELGIAALLTPRDSLCGPLTLPDGVSVFRVLGKRVIPDSAGAASALAEARDLAQVDQRAARVARHVAELAERERLRLDYATLQRVDIASIEVLTRRSLGFGGSMLAAPTLTPLWDWVPIWRAARPALP